MKVGYCRVSTKEQALDHNALEQQKDRILCQGVKHLYCDIKSGREESRPEYQELLKQIKLGRVTELVITRMDRLTRSLKTQLALIPLLQKHNVVLTVLDQSVDMDTSTGNLHLNIVGAFSQHYSDELSEKVKHGFDYFRKLKKAHSAILGYKIVKNKIVVDNDPFVCLIETKTEYSRYDLARLVIETFLEKKSLFSCLKYLNSLFGLTKTTKYSLKHHKSLHFSLAGINTTLKHPHLRGHLVYFYRNKQVPTQYHFNNHPPIISEKEYFEVQEIMKRNRKIRGYGFVSDKPFTGCIYCGTCLGTLTALTHHNSNSIYNYYRCYNSYIKACSNNKAIRSEKITQAFFLKLQSKYTELTNLTLSPNEDKKNTAEIRLLQTQIQSLSLLPKNPAIDQAIANIELQIQFLESEQSQVESIYSENENYLKAIFASSGFWESLLPHQLKEVVQTLVDRILVFENNTIEINLKI